MIMLIKAIELTLFPAVMAFADRDGRVRPHVACWCGGGRTGSGLRVLRVRLDRRRDRGVPYGIALVAAALVVYPHTAWMAAIRRPPKIRELAS